MRVRTAGIFIIIAILFSYFPVEVMGNCSEEDHSGNRGMECGYIFHCPMISHPIVPSLTVLSRNGWLRWESVIEKIEGFPMLIFHPPKHFSKYDQEG